MQDNARAHTARNTISFFNENSIKLLTWPPYNPDLNIIEEVWSIISEKVYNRPQYRCKNDLWWAIEKTTSGISKDNVGKLFNAIPDLICQCIKNDGNIV